MLRPRHKNKAIKRLSSHPSRWSLCFDSKLVVVVVVIGLMETGLMMKCSENAVAVFDTLLTIQFFERSRVLVFLPTSQISHVKLIDNQDGWSSLALSSIISLIYSQQIIHIIQELNLFQVSLFETHLRVWSERARTFVIRGLAVATCGHLRLFLRKLNWACPVEESLLNTPFLCIFHTFKLVMFNDIS